MRSFVRSLLAGRTALVAVCLCGIALAACGSADEFQGTYDEATPIPAGEDYAYKLSLFRFGDEVGGVARFYEIEGPDEARANTRDRPFLYQSYCAYFGPVTVSGSSFVFSVRDGPDGQSYLFRVSAVDPNDIQADVSRGASSGSGSGQPLAFVLTDATLDRSCQPPASTFQVVVDLPSLTVDEAPNLSLAVAFAGYERTPGTDERLVTRYSAVSNTVTLDSPSQWATTQRIHFPLAPDRAGLSDPSDGVQFGVGYLVLYDDGNRDGVFSHNVVDDRVLALSPDRVVLFVAGSPDGLHPSIQARFAESTDILQGYGLYQTQTQVSGEAADIVGLVPLRSDVRIALERISADNPKAFPELLP